MRRQLEAASAFIGPKTSFVSFQIDIPALAPSSLFHAFPDRPVFALDETIGLGATAELRLDRLDATAAKAWVRGTLGEESIGGRSIPTVFCGAAFAPRTTGQGRWRDFPAFYSVLPRWIYRPDRGNATVTLTLSVAEALDRNSRAQAIAELNHLVAGLEASPAKEPVARPVQVPFAAWEALIDSALREIRLERFRKLVLARTATIEIDEDWNAGAVFERLGAEDGTTFAVRLGTTTFLGSTPERLIFRAGKFFETVALAGTLAAGAGETQLLGSTKDREEHRLVVEEILRRLAPLCSVLEAAEAPTTSHLRDVIHLRTPISGLPREGVHLLDLACALHPTPALGGLPSDQAVEWICAHEPEPRGWYGGFVGWINRLGWGEMSVAIRSGVISGREAVLYTGAGIVSGSNPASEYQETEWKQRPFLRALGLELPT